MTSSKRTTLLVASAAIAGLAAGLATRYLSGLQEGRPLAGIEGPILAVVFLGIDAIILVVGAIRLLRARGEGSGRGVTLLAVGFAALAAGWVAWELGPERPYH